jgi:hypothetical protein
LLEQETEEIFVCNVGNLPPGKEVTIQLSYVTELTMSGDYMQFTLPTTVSPPPPPVQTFGFSFGPAPTKPTFALDTSFGISVNVDIEMVSSHSYSKLIIVC